MGRKPRPGARDEPISLDPLDPEEALRALLQVDPDAPVVDDEPVGQDEDEP